MHFKLPSLIASLVGLGLLAGCGGGGGTGGSAGSATLKGVVLTADGTTDALGGYAFRILQTGRRAVTNTEGQFDLGTVPTGQLTIALDGFSTIQAPVFQKDGVDDDSSDDDSSDDDGSDDDGPNHDAGDDHGDDDDFEDEQGILVDDDSVTIIAVRDGENMVVEVRIDGGRLSEAGCSRSRDDRREVERRLARTEASDDVDIKGELELRSQSDREKLEVEVEQATPGRVLELFVIDDGGNEESQGVRTVSSFGEAEWEQATNDGERLPFDVSAVSELEGFVVEVRDAGSGLVLLRGEVPDVPATAGGQDDDDDDDDGDDDGDDEDSRGRSRLTAHESGLEGYVEIRSRTDDNRERFEMEAEHLAAGRTVEFFIEDALGSATFVSLGTRTAGSYGEAELELDTGDGDTLPLDVSSASALTGFAVEVRDASTNALLLSGVVPVAHED
ncbi:MAG: hypothetical protein AB7T63_12165 [Planctomycetota bacterium]